MAPATIAFLVVASVCGVRSGVDLCTVQTTRHTVATRAECVVKAQEMVKNAMLVFGYIKVVAPFKTSIRCKASSPNPEVTKDTKSWW